MMNSENCNMISENSLKLANKYFEILQNKQKTFLILL